MDEPTASLDFGNQTLVLQEIAGLAADGLTVILLTHDPDHAFAVGTDAALLHEGRVQATGAGFAMPLSLPWRPCPDRKLLAGSSTAWAMSPGFRRDRARRPRSRLACL